MQNDILDSTSKDESHKGTIRRLLILSLIFITVSLAIEFLIHDFGLSRSGSDSHNSKIYNYIVLVLYILFPILLCNSLNNITPKLNIAKVIAYSGIIMIISFGLFKIFQFGLFLEDDRGIILIRVLIAALTFTLTGMSIVSIRICYLRKRRLSFPIMVLIVLLFIIGFYYKTLLNNI